MRWLSSFAAVLLLGISACSSNSPTPPRVTSGRESPPPPCHPGCFPAGTMIATPAGPRPIETVRRGDLVTLVGPDGTPTSGPVDSTFQTCNRLVEVQTESGNLLTTQSQPLCLRGGGFRPAGELTAGDLIWQWQGGERRPAVVRAVVPSGRDEPVFNLVVGESNVFIAGEFLARGKLPPAE